MENKGKSPAKFGIKYNAPVTLTFALICLEALILGYATKKSVTREFFAVYRSKVSLAWFVRLVGHSLGHIDFDHFFG